MKTIKEQLADKIADQAMKEVLKWNNEETLYENEVHEFIGLIEKSMLEWNGYCDCRDDQPEHTCRIELTN